jgi:hypothetical protein
MLTEEQAQRIAEVMADRRKRWEMSPGEAVETIEVLLEDRAEMQAALSMSVQFVGEWANMDSCNMPLCFDNAGCGCPRCRARRWLNHLVSKGLLPAAALEGEATDEG